MAEVISKIAEQLTNLTYPEQESHSNDKTDDHKMPDLPEEYTAAFFEEVNGPLVFKKVKLQQPKHGEILVKVLACGMCHSEFILRSGHMGPLPRVPGHEIIGDVVAVPDSENRWKVGDRVGGPWHGGHCDACKACQLGVNQMCKNGAVNGISRDGGFAEYVLLRKEAVVPIPKDMDPVETAPLLCAGITCFNAVRKQNITPGGLVAVQGLGGLGHLGIQYMNKMGYRTVAISSSDAKKDFAMKLGAHDYIDGSKGDIGEQLQKMGGADCILVTAPNAKLMGQLMKGLGLLGTMVIVAVSGPFEIDPASDMLMKGAKLTMWPSGHALDSEQAVHFAKTHGVKCMVEKFKLEDANDALNKLHEGKMRFRAVLVP